MEVLQMTWQLNLQKRKPGLPPLGLKNLGNTCYLNSVLQCLTYTPPLANFCLRGLHTRLCDSARECPFCILEKRISRSLSIDGAIDAPSKIESCLRIFAEHFQCGRQEDAHEFLRYVIDACHSTCLRILKTASSNGNKAGLEKDCNGGREVNTVVREIFGGALLSQVKCLSCSAESNKVDEIMDLSLDLYQSNSLDDALKHFFRPEILDGSNKYCCGSCKKLSEARKQIFVLEAPNVLVIQLKRFEGMYGAKINRDIAFQEVLVLSSFMCKASQDSHPEYNLFGSIVHSGYSSESGHYYAYIKDPAGRWYCCNDAYVSLSNSQAVLSEKVYILFFIRSNEKPKICKNNSKTVESNGNGMPSKLLDPKDKVLPKSASANGNGVLSAQNGVLRKEKLSSSGTLFKFSNSKNSELKKSTHRNENIDPNANRADESCKGNNSDHSQGIRQIANGGKEESRLCSRSNSLSTHDSMKPEAIADKISSTPSSVVNEAPAGKRKAENTSNSTANCATSTDKFLPGGLEKYKETIAAEASRKLRSCGWADEVHDFMRVHKRLCVESTDTGVHSDKTEIKKALIADAKKAFTSKLPNSIRQSLIDRLKLLSLGKSLPEKED